MLKPLAKNTRRTRPPRASCTPQIEASVQNSHVPITHYTQLNQGLALYGLLNYSEQMLQLRERRKRRAHSEIVELIGEFGEARVQELLNTHRTTVKRWLDGSVEPPQAVLIALRAAVRGQLPGMEGVRYWEGWRFGRDGLLYSPAGEGFHAGDLMAQQYDRAAIQSLRSKVAELQADLARAIDHARTTDPAANDMMIRHTR